MVLKLQLFGGFRLTGRDGGWLRVSSRKSRALLTYLAVCPAQSCSRDRLMTLLWSDHPEIQARQSVRKELSRLRRSLADQGGAGLLAGADQVHLGQGVMDVDVARFRHLAGSCRLHDLEAARDLYGGAFLDGFHLEEEAFEAWARGEREELAEMAVSVLARLADLYGERGQLDGAVRALRQAHRLDPLRDDVLQSLLRHLAVVGRRAEAIETYRGHAARLRRELSVAPDPATVKLFDALSDGRAIRVAPAMLHRTAAPRRIAVALRPFVERDGGADSGAIVHQVAAELARFVHFAVVPPDNDESGRKASSARYLVEGEVARRGTRRCGRLSLRDNTSGCLIWTGAVDGPLDGGPEALERLARQAASRLASAVAEAEMSRVARKHEGLLDAAELVHLAKRFVRIGNKNSLPAYQLRGLDLAERAAELDPGCSDALATLSWGYTYRHLMRWGGGRDQLAPSRQASDHLLALEPGWHTTHLRLGWQAFVGGDHAGAARSLEQARRLNPNEALCHGMLAFVEATGGCAVSAEACAREAIALNPEHPELSLFFNALQVALMQQGRPREAVAAGECALAQAPLDATVNLVLTVCYAEAGLTDQAGRAYARVRERTPAYLGALRAGERRPFVRQAASERFLASLDRARHAAERR